MMTSFSLPGFPSAFSFLMAFASELCALALLGVTAAVNPIADKMEPRRRANVLRVEVKSMLMLLSVYDFYIECKRLQSTNADEPTKIDLRAIVLLLQTPNFFHSLHNRLPLLDQCVHRVFLVVHLLGQREHRLRLSLWNNCHAIAIGNNDIAGIHRHSIAHNWNL